VIVWHGDEPEPVPAWWESPGALAGLALGWIYVVAHEALFALVARIF
jgi:hypothetical protein